MNFVKSYHHVALFVQDSEKSLNFYKGLGGKIVFSFPMSDDNSKTIYLVNLGGDAVIEIVPRGTGEAESNARWAHIALATDDARAAYDFALSKGAKSKIAPQDIMLGTKAVCNAFVFGYDGESIEFFQEK
ncbi:MAG: VOC family protein [Elusimicrobiota bacterium]|jgi:lactoylglutathione lyase|nr:VOC family protein [Elusimicrobiota bacterium]